MDRRSSNVEAHRLFTELVKERVPTICFAKARVVAELIHRYTVDALTREKPELAKLVRPYRGGYLPKERREIEKAQGDLAKMDAKLSNPQFMAKAKEEAVEEARERKAELEGAIGRLKAAVKRLEAAG